MSRRRIILRLIFLPLNTTRIPQLLADRHSAAGVDLQLAPLVAAQELITACSTGVTYWEGAVDGKGSSSGRQVTCEG